MLKVAKVLAALCQDMGKSNGSLWMW